MRGAREGGMRAQPWKMAMRAQPGPWLPSRPAGQARGTDTNVRPEAYGSCRNRDGFGGDSGYRRDMRPSRTRLPPLTCGTHKLPRLREGDRHSATRRRNVVIKLRLASRLPYPGGKRTFNSADSYRKRRMRKIKVGRV